MAVAIYAPPQVEQPPPTTGQEHSLKPPPTIGAEHGADMTSFNFNKPVPTTGYGTPTQAHIKQAATFSGPYTQVGVNQPLQDEAEKDSGLTLSGRRYEITAQSAVDFTTIGAISNDIGTQFVSTGQVALSPADKVIPLGLEDKPGDSTKYTITEANAVDTYFTRIYLLDSAGVENCPEGGIEAEIGTPETFQVFAYSKDAGLGIVTGAVLDIAPIGGYTPAGDITILQRAESTTDTNGRAAIDTIPADSGFYNVNFGGYRKKIDSTGLGGTSVNWKDITS